MVASGGRFIIGGGGAQMNGVASGFYHSGAWAQCREAYRRYRGGLCERCLKNGLVKAGEDVHHKVRLTIDNINDPTVTLNFDNLELLCRECHAAEHSSKRFTVDALGKVITDETCIAESLREMRI